MSIVLVGSTSGSITLQEPAVSGSTVLSLPAVTGTILTTTSPKAGNVIQVVNATTSTQTSTGSSTYTDTTLSASITPTSSSSKILVIINQNGVSKSTGNTYVGLQLVRNSTSLVVFETQLGYTNSALETNAASGVNYLDSPATTSSTTYKTQFRSPNSTNFATVQTGSAVSSITLMEIAA
jgi:hypothetical protein